MTIAEHPAVRAVTETLSARGVGGEVRILPDSARTAAAAADALSVEVGAIVNSLVFDADGDAVLILTSGAHRVDTDKVARDLGLAALTRATPDFVRAHTGQAIGGVAPVGHPNEVRTLMDRSLRRFDTIWAAAGHPHAVFPTRYDELLAATGATPVDVA